MRTSQPATRAQQLDLPSSLTQAVELSEGLSRLSQTATWQQAEITALRLQIAQLHADRDTWLEAWSQAQAQVTTAHAEIALLKTNLRVAHGVLFNSPAALPDWLSQELKRLLAVSHPDKWSQGQSAETLAHEVASALNGLRQRLGEGTKW